MTKRELAPAERVLTTAEVARLFGVHAKTVTRWEEDNKLTSFKTPGGHRRYYESEVRALMRGATTQPATEQASAGLPNYPLSATHRPDLAGYEHSITLERLTTSVARLVNMDDQVGHIVIVERREGGIAKVVAATDQENPEPGAKSIAHTYDADYVAWDGAQ